MALGRIPVYMLSDRPRGGQRPNRAQQPDRVLLGDLFAALFGRNRRAVEIAVVPKRSVTYFGATRPARAPRILPLGRANEPTEQLRRTLVGRTRYFQDQVRRQGASRSAGGGGVDQ